MTAADIVALVERQRLDLSDEKRTQADLAEALTNAGAPFRREVHLGKGEVIDFMVGTVGVEVKLRTTGKMAIYRQLVRYANYDAVESLVLVSNLAMGLPERICGKPAFIASLGRGWM